MTEPVLVAAIGGGATVLVSLVPLLIAMWRTSHRISHDVVENKGHLRTIHVLVNSQRAEAARYTAMLIVLLENAGIDVPKIPEPEQVDRNDV